MASVDGQARWYSPAMWYAARRPDLLIVTSVLCLLLAACGSEAVTAPGTAILEWDRGESERDNIKTAKPVGEPTSYKKLLQAAGKAEKPFSVEFDFDTQGFNVVEDGKSARHTTVSKLTMKVAANDFWKLSASCKGPDYQLPEGGTTAEAMLLHCTVKMKHGDQHDELVALELYGDGNVNALGTKVSITDRP